MYATISDHSLRVADARARVSTPTTHRHEPIGHVIWRNVHFGGTSTELRELAKVLEDLAMEVDAVEQEVPA